MNTTYYTCSTFFITKRCVCVHVWACGRVCVRARAPACVCLSASMRACVCASVLAHTHTHTYTHSQHLFIVSELLRENLYDFGGCV